ncbi:MAG: large conductance mechanosensitive channel protein MscL [Antricoccus sp.]
MKGFKDFIMRGNVVDLAVAVVIGTAFTALVTSFTNSFINPLIGLIGGGGKVGGEFVVNGQRFTYGAFITAIITFTLIAAVVYFVIVMPMKKIQDRRKAGIEEGPAQPTEIELLAQIRDSLLAPVAPAHAAPEQAAQGQAPQAQFPQGQGPQAQFPQGPPPRH